MNIPVSNFHNQHQAGFVLIACLIILLVLTILGVSSMKNARLQQRTAAESQNKFGTFQAAESAVNDAIERDSDISKVIISGTPVTSTYDYGNDYTTTTTASAGVTDTRYMTGFSLNKFSSLTVEIVASSASASNVAMSQVSIGVTRVIPKK